MTTLPFGAPPSSIPPPLLPPPTLFDSTTTLSEEIEDETEETAASTTGAALTTPTSGRASPSCWSVPMSVMVAATIDFETVIVFFCLLGRADALVFGEVDLFRGAFLEGEPTPPGAGPVFFPGFDPGGLFSPSCRATYTRCAMRTAETMSVSNGNGRTGTVFWGRCIPARP